LTILRHVIFQPIGLAPAEYPLAGDRATFYVPRSDDNPRRGRRLMYMRDLACCATGVLREWESVLFHAFRSGTRRPGERGSVNGELAGGMVMSLITLRDSGIVVADPDQSPGKARIAAGRSWPTLAHPTALLEEVRERGVIEQGFRFDRLCRVGRMRMMR
jgi:hypothetical protein